MPYFLILFFMYFFEWSIVFSYSKSIYDLKHKYFVFISGLFYLFLMIIYGYVINNEFVNVILTAACNILCIFVCFKSSFKSALFHGISLLIIQCVSEAVSIYIVSHLTNTANNAYTKDNVIFIIDVVLSKILYFTFSRILSRVSGKESSSHSGGQWVSLSILPISSIFILTTFRLLTNGMTFSNSNNILCILSITLLLLANILVYVIYENSEKNNQKIIELEMVNQKNDIDLQYLNLLEKKNEQMQIMTHDYKNHILDIKSMSDSPEIKAYINDMLGEISEFNKKAKTKNKLLDVILCKYTDICKDKQIDFEIETISENIARINNNMDISSLFNNLLDNAVEAAEQSNEKFVKIQITNSINSYHKITVINSCDSKPNSKKEKLITTKLNKDAHGFGTKSIKKIVNKYHGEMQWEYDEENRQFKVIILIPIEQ